MVAVCILMASAWTAKWIGPAPETRPDEDFGAVEWISAPADAKGAATLDFAFDCAEIPADKAVEMVHAGLPDYEIDVNGRLFYKWSGHVRDVRYPVFRDMRPWLREGRNAIRVRLTGTNGAFIAKVARPGRPLLTTGADWTSPSGPVKALGKMRETEEGRRMVLRTEKVSPAFAKRFRVKGPVASAQLRVTGVGFYEAHLNGRKLGDKVLDPSPTAYDKRVLYSTYDLKNALAQGENELLILLGHGWYDVRSVATWNFEVAPWRDFPRTIAQLDLAYADGTRETVATDASWRQVANPVAFDDVYEGEVQDGRIRAGAELPGGPLMAVEVDGPRGRLVPEEQPGAKVMKEVRASAVHPLGDGACLIEFPVNVAGWMRLPLYGQKSGDVVSFRYDERANGDGTPAADSARDGLHDKGAPPPRQSRHVDEHFRYPASFRFCAKDAAFQCDRYICRGEDGETYEPRFSYKGFRYVLVRGLARLPKAEDAVACIVHTGFRTIGSFDCSDATFNRLVEMGERAYKGNFADGVPTDCPHREKNGWTGDASIASELAQYLFENTAGYEKWLRDILDAQRPDGDLPGIVPTSGWGFEWGNGPAWDSALPVIAWNLWIYRGDRKILGEVYPALRRYLAFTATKADANGLVRHGLGDWVPVNWAHMPSVEFTSSCYYHQAQRIAAEMAKVLGRPDEAVAFDRAAEKTRKGLRARCRKGEGVWDNGGQTAQGMALAFGLVEEGERPAVERRLVASVERAGGHVDLGLLGSKHVFRALSRAGRTDFAWKMLTNPTSPSPVDWIRKDGTTLWEDWDDGSSRNHIMFGDFVGWAYQYLAGLRLAEAAGSTSAVTVPVAPAFRQVVIDPVFLPELDHLAASTETPTGRLGVSWRRNGGRIEMVVTVPPKTKALIRTPRGETIEKGEGVWTFAAAELPSGSLRPTAGSPVRTACRSTAVKSTRRPIGSSGRVR